jgi:CheY-like chemotaxis protein
MGNWSEKKILIAEDELANYLYIKAILKKTNVTEEHAENGAKAIEMLKTNDYDLILMDLKMPVMDGFEATKLIRKTNKKMIIIAQTAFAFKRDECIEMGFTDFISKPYTKDQLIDLFDKYLKN